MRKVVFSVSICLLAGVIVFLAAQPMSGFDISLTTGSLYMSEQSAYSSREAALSGKQLDGKTNYSGPIVESGSYDLDPGTYTFYVYGVFECNAVFELYSPRYASLDNSPGRVFASANVDRESGRAALYIYTNEVIRGARLRISRSGEGAITIAAITGKSDGYSDAYVLAALAMLAAALAVFFLARRKNDLERHAYTPAAAVFCCVLAAVISTAPLARQTLMYSHDVSFHLCRIDGIADGLRSGQFPVRLNPTFLGGYGYADPTMYPATFLYFPAVLRILGVSTIVAYQVFMLAINSLTAALAYLCFKRLFRRRDLGIFASVAYTLCLYRLICVFTRGAVGELLAMAFLPAVLLGMYEVFFGEPRAGSRWLAVGFLGLVNCHVLSLEIAVIFCAVFFLFNTKRITEPGRLRALLGSAAVVLVLSLWIIVPMLSLMRQSMYATAYSRDITNDAVYPFELFATFIRSNGLSGNLDSGFTGMPLTVGGLLAIGALLFVFMRFFMRAGNQEHRQLETLGSAGLKIALLALFISSTLFPWAVVAKIPYLGEFLSSAQFPWRYLGVASIMLVTVMTVAVARLLDMGNRRLVLFALLAVIALNCAPYLDGYMQNEEQGVMLSKKFTPLSTFYIGGQEYLHVGTSKTALEERGPTVTTGGAYIGSMTKRYLNVSFTYENKGSYAFAELPLYYYDGYAAKDSTGTPMTVYEGTNGVVSVALPEGSGKVSVSYNPPASYRVAEGISLLACAVITVRLLRKRRKNGKFNSAAE